MTMEQIKSLSGRDAILYYRQYSDDIWAAGWMGTEDEPPFEHFVQWLLSKDDPPSSDRPFFEIDFEKEWDKWRSKKKRRPARRKKK